MITEYERYYCKTCNELFKEAKHTAYYTLNNFVDNQNCLIDGEEYKHNTRQPTHIVNCPRCNSIHNIAVDDVLLTMKSVKGTNNKAGFNQYNKGKAKLYKRVIDKLEATKHLNNMHNIQRSKVKR